MARHCAVQRHADRAAGAAAHGARVGRRARKRRHDRRVRLLLGARHPAHLPARRHPGPVRHDPRRHFRRHAHQRALRKLVVLPGRVSGLCRHGENKPTDDLDMLFSSFLNSIYEQQTNFDILLTLFMKPIYNTPCCIYMYIFSATKHPSFSSFRIHPQCISINCVVLLFIFFCLASPSNRSRTPRQSPRLRRFQ